LKPKYEVATVLNQNQEYLTTNDFNGWQRRVLFALMKCRTAALGGHIDKCNHVACGTLHLSYNSCRNRHCPKCQGHKREEWISKREEDLLPIGYYHVVFTLPCELNALALYNSKLVYNTLFKTAWAVIKGFGENPDYLGAQTGMISILHTWGQNMSLHPHLHCIVPSGGVDKKGNWKWVKKKDKYLYPVREMSNVFRAKYVAELRRNGIVNQELFDKLFTKNWVVYAKRPFKHARDVVEYLGRYTHKIAISNHRIKSINNQEVIFSAKNYRKDGKKECLSLHPKAFIRRFSLHILPKGFVRIRHYGFLSSTGKQLYLKKLQDQLGKPNLKTKRETMHLVCPKCKQGRLVTVAVFDARGPPKHWLAKLFKNKIHQKLKIKR